MHLNDRGIRDELRKQAMSVPIPDDMWANISRELAKDAPKAAALAPAVARVSSHLVQVRQTLAIGAVAGIFWMMVIPSGAYVDRLKQPSPSPVVASTAAALTGGDIPWDVPTEAQLKERKAASAKGGSGVGRPSPENTLFR